MKATQPRNVARLPERIVVALDADALSDHAIAMGIDLGRRFGATVDLVHVLATGLLGTAAPVDPRRVADESDLSLVVERRMAAHVELLIAATGFDSKFEYELLVKSGHPARVLIDHVQERDAGLLVLGSLRKHSGLDFGSTARAILAQARCPVLVQPKPCGAIQRILVAFDMSSESRLALATACAWARSLGARVRVLHCFDTTALNPGLTLAGIVTAGAIAELTQQSRLAFEREVSAFDWGDVQHETAFVEGAPVTRILDAAQSADLVVMGTHGRSGFAAALIGSVAYAVLKHAPTPILVVRDSDRKFQV